MEQRTDFSPLQGQGIDPDTFRRVWERVMPDQSRSPLSVDPPDPAPSAPETSVPARPSPRPETGAETGAAASLPPVPACSVPTCSVPTCSVPTCSVPTCPAPWPEEGEGNLSGPCLGEAARPSTGQLEELMALAREGAAAGRALANRATGSGQRTLAALSADHRRALRQLSAAYFLITGRRYQPPRPTPALSPSLPLALRQQFRWEQRWEQTNLRAARDTGDPCLRALFTGLAREGALHASAIRALLEQM